MTGDAWGPDFTPRPHCRPVEDRSRLFWSIAGNVAICAAVSLFALLPLGIDRSRHAAELAFILLWTGVCGVFVFYFLNTAILLIKDWSSSAEVVEGVVAELRLEEDAYRKDRWLYLTGGAKFQIRAADYTRLARGMVVCVSFYPNSRQVTDIRIVATARAVAQTGDATSPTPRRWQG